MLTGFNIDAVNFVYTRVFFIGFKVHVLIVISQGDFIDNVFTGCQGTRCLAWRLDIEVAVTGMFRLIKQRM